MHRLIPLVEQCHSFAPTGLGCIGWLASHGLRRGTQSSAASRLRRLWSCHTSPIVARKVRHVRHLRSLGGGAYHDTSGGVF